MTQIALGSQFNVVASGSGIHVPLTNYAAVSFITFEDDGTTTLTLKESINGTSEQNLVVITEFYKGPGIGGTWTRVAQAAAATASIATDATNDAMVLTIGADQLSDGFNCLEATVDGGYVVVVMHDPLVGRTPANLQTTVV